MHLDASKVEIFAVKVEVDFYFEMEEVHIGYRSFLLSVSYQKECKSLTGTQITHP